MALKRKRPKNALDVRVEGYGLWQVYQSDDARGAAEPVGPEWLTLSEADAYAVGRAKTHAAYRYKAVPVR